MPTNVLPFVTKPAWLSSAVLLLLASHAVAVDTPLTIDGHLIKKNGQPIFFMGDTKWTVAVRYTDAQMDSYLDDARAKRFNLFGVFGTPTWAYEPRGDRMGKNRFGDPPFVEGDPTRLNDGYWDRYRTFVSKAKTRGMTVFVAVGGPLEGRTLWGNLTDAEAYAYGYALGAKFRDLNDAIIWSPAQDSRAGDARNRAGISLSRLRNCTEGITDGVQGKHDRDGKADYRSTFMTFHCQGNQTSAAHYHDEAWLDFNGIQTQWANSGRHGGKDRWYGVGVGLLNASINRAPAKPVVNLEACYEGHKHARARDPGELKGGWHVRMEAYWGWFTGEAGHVTGTDGLWDCWDPAKGIGLSRSIGLSEGGKTYKQALNAPGRNDMQWLVALMETKPLAGYRAAQEMVVDPRDPDTDKDYIAAARDVNQNWAFVYTTDGRDIALRMGQLNGPAVNTRWYNPREGTWHGRDGSGFRNKQPARTAIRSGDGAPVSVFDPPGDTGKDHDWVLVLERVDADSH